jgi:YfiR/HmsC-like
MGRTMSTTKSLPLRLTGFKILVSLLCCVLCMAAPVTLQAQETQKLRLVKAAFVLNIAKFVTWPKQVYLARPDTLNLCYYRQDVLAEAYEIIRGRRVGSRQLQSTVVEELSRSEACDLILVPAPELERVQQDALNGFDIPALVIADLTSNEGQGVAYDGVAVSLVRRGNRVGFEINLQEAKRLGFTMSSELLKLAHIVGGHSSNQPDDMK